MSEEQIHTAAKDATTVDRPPDLVSDLGPGSMMETIPEAARRLRADGFTSDFDATEEGLLLCGVCDSSHDPAEMTIHETVRYEGATNPSDETILIALECSCGAKGLYYAGFGPNATRADARVLRHLP